MNNGHFSLLFVFLFTFTTLIGQYDCIIDDEFEQSNPGFTCSSISMTVEEILKLPDIEFKLVFNFVADSQGNNFTCNSSDPIVNINPLLYAPTFANQIVNEMNTRMDQALLLNGQNTDAKINFSIQNSGSCNGLYFYSGQSQIVSQPNAININIFNTSTPGIRGYTFYGSNNIYIENLLTAYFQNQSNNWWDPARLMLHEFGHTRSLKHTFNCSNPCNGIDLVVLDECCGQCWPTDSNSSGCWGCSGDFLIMAYGTQLHFTECEFEEIWNYMLNNPRSYQNINFCSFDNNEVVYDLNGTDIWNSNKVFSENVRIKSGTTIEIQCEVLMGVDRSIIVEEGGKLIVNGGSINKLCQDNWSGIKVYGGNQDFDVELKNSATISNTDAAAVSMFAPVSWPDILQYGNGILHAENSNFNNVKRIAEFMAWSPSNNTSFIKDCIQNGGKWSITNWNCIGIEVSGNEFSHVSNECIVTETGQFLIKNNTFHSDRADILFANVSPGVGTIIKENIFEGDDTGIRSLGTTYAQNEIYNNDFDTGEIDLFFDGDNNYLVFNNNITSDFGSVSIQNGSHSNEVYLNAMFGNIAGILTEGSNDEYIFYQNCFGTSYSDVYIDGSVTSYVSGPTGEPAYNCFTHGGDSNSSTMDISGFPDSFDYIEPTDQVDDCYDVLFANQNVNIIESGDTYNPCGIAGNNTIIIPSYNPCNPEHTEQDTEFALNWLWNKIAQINNDPYLSQWQKDWLTRMYKRCIRRVYWLRFQILLENDQFNTARTMMDTLNYGDDTKVAIYGSFIHENDLNGALSYLQSLNNESERIEDFITIQSINLNRIKKGKYYVANSSELQTVLNIANKSHSYSTYAKALYYHLTGIIIESELPNNFEQQITPRKSNTSDDKLFNYYPNPASSILTVNSKGYENTEMIITDLLGKVHIRTIVKENLTVDLNSLNTGVYLIHLTNGDEILLSKKLLVTH